jgi:inorganic pyrophosphatase
VPVRDPLWNQIRTLSDITPHLLKEIEHFFKIYKDLEKKKTGIEGWDNLAAAIRTIEESKERFLKKNVASKKKLTTLLTRVSGRE